MAFFKSSRKNDESKSTEEIRSNPDLTISSVKVLGSGCAKCNQLEKATSEALSELSIDQAIEHVTDFTQIAKYGVMSTPALVINEQVVSYGKVLKAAEVKKMLISVGGKKHE